MNLPIIININDATGKSFQFETLELLTDFVDTELKFWKSKFSKQQENGLHIHQYLNVYNNFQNALTVIKDWQPSLPTWDTNTFNSHLSTMFSNYLTPINGSWLWSGHPFIDSWLKCYEISVGSGDGFLASMAKKDIQNISNYDWFQGYLLAYEFKFQGDTQFTQRRQSEKASFASIRQQIVTKKDELILDVSNFQADFNNWKIDTEQLTDHWHKGNIKLVEDMSLKHSNDFQERISAWTSKVAELETLFKEKLRFESSASYWNKSADKFRKQGFYWVLALILTSVSAITYFTNFFISWLQGQKTAIQLNSIEGIILFGVIISSFAILVRTFSRLTFSSFHLQRDAEEREQLTHLYLALGNETEVDSDSRKIILQSLFSRSETGLLANESGPAMPGINDLTSILSKKT